MRDPLDRAVLPQHYPMGNAMGYRIEAVPGAGLIGPAAMSVTPHAIPLSLRDIVHPEVNWTVPETTASTITEYSDLVLRYQQLVKQWPVRMLCRGQNCDYFHSAGDCSGLLPTECIGQISLLPAAYRTVSSYDFWDFGHKTQLEVSLIPWLDCLEAIGVRPSRLDLPPGRAWFSKEKGFGFIEIPARLDPRPGAWLIRTPEILAVTKHYGFPTPSLDVTTDPLVALWFATNAANMMADGTWHYSPIPNPTDTSDLSKLPSVYVFLQWDLDSACPVVNLAALKKLRDHALRPSAQSAAGLPVDWLLASLGAQPGYLGLSGTREFRYPSAVIKILFGAAELEAHYPALCQEALFPLHDPIYNALLAVNAPHVARYGAGRFSPQ